jgi:hypothetical protein
MAGIPYDRSSLLLGLVGFASQIPVFLIAPLGGMVVRPAQSSPRHYCHPDVGHAAGRSLGRFNADGNSASVAYLHFGCSAWRSECI